MKATIAILATTIAAGITANAFADESASSKSKTENKGSGGYESTHSSESTNPEGTTTTIQKKKDVDVDESGEVKRQVTEDEKTTDPKGLWNKKTDKEKTVYEKKKNGGYTQTTFRSYKDRAGMDIYYKTVTEVDIDDNGNVITTAKTEKTTEPKGWMSWLNKHTTSSETKTINGEPVDEKHKSD